MNLLKLFQDETGALAKPTRNRGETPNYWSAEEIKYLICNSNKKTVREISKALNRSYSAIYQRLLRLKREGKVQGIGVKEDRCYLWTPERVEFLVNNYPQMQPREIAKALNLTPIQVRSKVTALGKKRGKNDISG